MRNIHDVYKSHRFAFVIVKMFSNVPYEININELYNGVIENKYSVKLTEDLWISYIIVYLPNYDKQA